MAAYVAQHPEKLIGFFSRRPDAARLAGRTDRGPSEPEDEGNQAAAHVCRLLAERSASSIISGSTRPSISLPVLLHTGTTFVSQAPLECTLPRLLDDVAIRFPDVKMIMAHLSHPYEGECVVTIRKHPNVYADCSALHYRPFQLYHSLMLLQEYGVWHKLLFGSDYPFTTVDASLAGMRGLNDMLEGTCLPRLNMDKMEQMFFRDTLEFWKSTLDPADSVRVDWSIILVPTTIIYDPPTIDFNKPGKHHYQVAFHLDGTWGYSLVPLTVINGLRGSNPNGVVCFGGTHGNEYEGQVAVKRLCYRPRPGGDSRARDPDSPVERERLHRQLRISPLDGVNMNRAFPGNARGTISYRISHFVKTRIFPLVRVVLDIHSGGKEGSFPSARRFIRFRTRRSGPRSRASRGCSIRRSCSSTRARWRRAC